GGQVVFGEIDKGTYSVSAPIPGGYYVPQGETIESGNVVRKNIIIDSWSVRDIYFYMDKLENYSKLSIKLLDENGDIITQPGSITMSWNMDFTNKVIFTDRPFASGNITPDIIDRLWPLGTYNIKISFPGSEDYLDYDMSTSGNKPVIEGTNEEWDGSFSEPGETINLEIQIASKPSIIIRDAFSIIQAEDYDEASREYTKSSEDGGVVIMGMSGNNYTMYQNVDFDTGARLFIARASSTSDRTITLRVDSVNGPIISTLNFKRTSSSSTNYQEQSCWVNGITGIHDLYLVYSGDFRFNWFTFRRVFDQDNFDDESVAGAWTFFNGSWAENGGVLKQTSSSKQDPKKAILSNAGFDQSTDYTIKAKVYVQSWLDSWLIDDDMARAGVSLYTNTTNGQGYNLLFHRTNNRNRVQFLDDGRGWSAEYAFSWQEQTWYWFKLKSEGTTLYGKIWQEGSPEPVDWLFVWTTPHDQREGYPALNGGSGDCRIWFDDVSVSTD
ncbi:MAG: carbohydrate-binding protein, partial [Acetivibrionales bacterium]